MIPNQHPQYPDLGSLTPKDWKSLLSLPHSGEFKVYVVGFLFRDGEVALVEKRRPDWQKGFLNGIGGRVEVGETPLAAMVREFSEEAGAKVYNWRNFGVLSNPEAPMAVALYAAWEPAEISTMTDEQVGWHKLSSLAALRVIPNLRWIIPAAQESGQFILARCER